MAQTLYEKEIKKIIKKTKQNMEVVGTYKPEFDATIKMYAEMKYQYDKLMVEHMEQGFKVTEEYTNKAGATNIRKTATYLALETLRKDILAHESILGLTPSGLKKIKATIEKKNSNLAKVLSNIE